MGLSLNRLPEVGHSTSLKLDVKVKRGNSMRNDVLGVESVKGGKRKGSSKISKGCSKVSRRRPAQAMAKTPKNRQRKPGQSSKSSGKQVARRSQKVKKKHAKKKARSRQVDHLADQLAGISTTTKVIEKDSGMPSEPSAVPRQELKKKLRAKLAGHALDRTQGLEKGLQDHSGLRKQKRPPPRRKMDVS